MSRKQRRAEKAISATNQQQFVNIFNSALALQQAGDLAGAEAAYRKAKALNPNIALLYNNFGVLLYSQGRHLEAIEEQKKAVALDPTMGMSHNNMGVALNAMGRHEEALKAFSKAIEIQPTNYQAINNYGDSCVKTSRFEEGLAALRRSLALQPDYVEALTNLGAALWGLGQLDEAEKHLRRAIQLDPKVAMAHKNLGIVSLLKGNYQIAWREYDWRWQADKIPLKGHPKRVLDGQDIGAGGVFVWAEQGVGDEILQASMMEDFAALRAKAGGRVVWECDPRLAPLFRRSFPQVEVVARANPLDPAAIAPDIAVHLPAASMGTYVRNDAAKFPAGRRGYLKADPLRTAAFRQRLAPNGERLVGMSWLSKNLAFGSSKSTTLKQWAEIIATPGLKFVDLQYGDTTAEREAFARDTGLTLHHIDGLDLKDDLEGVASLIAACELVTTVSNTAAHVAAALGIPVWILVASGIGKFWYWGFDGPSTIWYPTASLIRQPPDEDWTNSLKIIASRLKDFAAG